MIDSTENVTSGIAETERCHQYLRERRRARAKSQIFPRVSRQPTTWFERQSVRLDQLESSPTRALTDEEREYLGNFCVLGPSVRVCEMRTSPDEFQIGFALNSPAANVLYGYNLKFAQQMALRMEMLTAQHSCPDTLVLRCVRGQAPHLLFAAVGRPRRPEQVRQASIGLGGSLRWFTDMSTSNRQILLVHRIGDLEPSIQQAERIEYLLAYPEVGSAEDQQ